jgi:protein N-terminal amidase
MKIATLQFAPRLGDVQGNIRRARELLERGRVVPAGGGVGAGGELTWTALEASGLEILVLPELALTG